MKKDNILFNATEKMENSITLGNLVINNVGIDKYIGQTKEFSPILCFKPFHRYRAAIELGSYLSRKESDAAWIIADHLPNETFESLLNSIKERYILKALELINDADYPLTKKDGYFIRFLKKNF